MTNLKPQLLSSTSDLPILPAFDFYLVRHGESEANVRQVAAGGGLDSPLTETGIGQAKALAAAIHNLPVKPSRIYHSPQIRAKHTAGYINEFLNLDMTEMDNLKEHMFGDWEEISWVELRALAERGENPPNGETYQEFAERIGGALHEIFKTPHAAPPMLVAHGGVFKSIPRLYGHRLEAVGNCALYHFQPSSGNAAFPWTMTSYAPCPETGLVKKLIDLI